MEYNREDQFSLDRLINKTNAAEGTALPPQQRGFYRIPFVTSVKAVPLGNSQYLVSWREPEGFAGKIGQYNVFAKINNSSDLPTQCGSSAKSPASVTVDAAPGDRITFSIQTQLTSGFTNPPGVGPVATVIALTGVQSLSSGPYTIKADKTVYLCDTTAASFTIYLPASPKTGFIAHVKKLVAANTLTVDGNGHDIDGAASLAITTQYVSYSLIYNGSEWCII